VSVDARRALAALPRAVTARHRTTAQILPIYVAILLLLLVGEGLYRGFVRPENIAALLVLATFTAVVAFGQGIVVLTGGLDLSVAWTMTMSGVFLTAQSQGMDDRGAWVIPLVLAVGTAIGVVNGLGVVWLGIAPIIMTLATNVVVQGVVMTLISGTPSGAAPPMLVRLTTGTVGGVPWMVIFLVVFTAAGTFVLVGTRLGRHLYAAGGNPVVAALSGVRTNRVLVFAYAASGFCAALAGMLAAAYTRTAFLSTGDGYLLPSIAAVIVAGASVFGGKGHYVATVGGAIFLTLLAAVLTSLNWPNSVRIMANGLVILAAVVVLGQREAQS
jgi:ribose transport system permease protein